MPGLWGCWCQVLARAAWQSDPGAPGGWRGLCCSLPPSATPRGHMCGCPCAPTCSAGQDVLLQDPAPRGRGAAALWGWAQEVQNLRGEPHRALVLAQKAGGFLQNPEHLGAAAEPWRRGFPSVCSPGWHFAGNRQFPYSSVCCGASPPLAAASLCMFYPVLKCLAESHAQCIQKGKVLVVPQLLPFPGGVLTEERDSWYPCSCCVWSSFAFNQREKDFGHPPKVPADMQQ